MVKEKKTVKKETTKKEEKKDKVNKTVKEEKKVAKKVDDKKKGTKKTVDPHKTTLRAEFNKIKWPTKKEMVKYSIAVIVFIVFCALFFWLIQFVMAGLMKLL